jgi:co-chaperonin GroES (HSP10)|tara:strand:- start:269 stop:685 length:417 start_codon:yes stop_codon:yes gene_type:complete
MMNPNMSNSITNDDWISEEEVADPKELPSLPGFHILIRPVTAKKKTKGGIIIPSKLQDDLSYLTTVGRVLKTGDLSYGDESKFPNGPWCKEGDYVCYGKLTGTKFVYQGVKMLLIYDDQVLMTIKDPSVLDTSINLVA